MLRRLVDAAQAVNTVALRLAGVAAGSREAAASGGEDPPCR